MLPSWIKPHFGWRAGPRESIGIALGRREVCLVHAETGKDGTHARSLESASLPDALFAGRPAAATEEVLASAFGSLIKETRNKFIPCHVALPDPAMLFAVFELEEMPKTESSRTAWVRWRLAKDYSLEETAVACAHQELGRENGKPLLLGQGMEQAWLHCVRRALARAGIVPWSLNLGACYRFNHYHDRFAETRQGAAMVVLDPDSWAVLLWDAAARPRMMRARWRGRGDDYDAVAVEAERAILSYVRAGREDTVTRVYALSHPRELESLAAALDRRLREKCTPLMTPHAEADKAGPFEHQGLAELSLAAALAA